LARNFLSRSLTLVGLPVSMLALTVGCETKSFLDPSEVGRWEQSVVVKPIMDNLNLDSIEETEGQFVDARDITEADQTDTAVDYEISPNDTLSISISDLLAPGTESVRTIRVSQRGQISLPLLPSPIDVKGKTEQQIERAIADAYRDAQVIQSAQVTVSVIEARGRTYTVDGAVNANGLYQIFDTDFRLLDALTTARGVTSTVGIKHIYVIRKVKPTDAASPTTAPAAPAPGAADPLAPQGRATEQPRKSLLLSQDAMQPAQPAQPAPAAPEGGIVVVEGQEVPVNAPATAAPEAAVPATAPTELTPGAPFEFNSLKEPADRIVLRVPYEALKNGQLKYNIVIKPGDYIWVPPPVVGEYYMGGNVESPGAYSLSAREITLSQAVVAARGLNEVAWPSRTEIVRRLPGNKQVFVRVDLDKIFAGLEPDVYLKADDRINVGTNALAPFLAAFRNGFRFTYGFGFLYDRNYYDDDDNNN
jgi:polysaccharide biosynthesis/export protein